MTKHKLSDPHGHPVGTYDDGDGDDAELKITDPATRRHLDYVHTHEGGVPAGPEGPTVWGASAILDYLRAAGYSLD